MACSIENWLVTGFGELDGNRCESCRRRTNSSPVKFLRFSKTFAVFGYELWAMISPMFFMRMAEAMREALSADHFEMMATLKPVSKTASRTGVKN